MEIVTAAITSAGKVELLTLETPELSGREVLVKVHAVAICTLEQRIFKGEVKMPYPCIGGHEVSGEIAAIGPEVNASRWKTGCRVAVRLLYSCGECHQCRSGNTNMCEKAQRKPVRPGLLPGPGGACNYIIVNSDALFEIPDDLPWEQAALTEPLSCVVHSIGRADIQLADDVVVIGAGIMGLFHVMLACRRGARVIVSEVDRNRRQKAIEYGASETIDPLNEDALQRIMQITESRGADVVFNTTPTPSVFAQAMSMVAKGGTLVQYSSLHPDVPTPVSPQLIHNNQITITGSISPKVEDFYTANRLLSSRIIDCSGLIEKTFPFAKAQDAYEEALRPDAFRVIITD